MGEARLDVTVETAAVAKVGAKGQAHFDLLQEGSDEPPVVPIWPAPVRRAMAIPKGKRRR